MATLEGWRPPDAGQRALRRSYLARLGARPDAWSRSSPGAHLTASSLICAADRPAVLLVLHRRLGRWLQTGGHLERTDQGLAAAARREAAEESGLDRLRLDPVPLLLSRHEVPCGPVRPTFHLDVQYLIVADRAEPAVSAESLAVRWFDADDLPEVDASVRALVAAASLRLGW